MPVAFARGSTFASQTIAPVRTILGRLAGAIGFRLDIDVSVVDRVGGGRLQTTGTHREAGSAAAGVRAKRILVNATIPVDNALSLLTR